MWVRSGWEHVSPSRAPDKSRRLKHHGKEIVLRERHQPPPHSGLRDQMKNLLLGLPFWEAWRSYKKPGEELGSHHNGRTAFS